jgi:hypothetical protein
VIFDIEELKISKESNYYKNIDFENISREIKNINKV